MTMRTLCSIGAVLCGLLAGCMPTMHHHMRATPSLDGLPEATRAPLHAGVYYSPEFASYEHVRKKGNSIFHMHIGEASVGYFDQLLPRVFEKTTRVDTLAPDELAKKGVDLVVVPSLEHFDFPLGFEPYSERLGVAYRTTLCTPQGVPVSSWIVYGSADHWKMFGGHIEAYMQQAGAKFARSFESESRAGLAAIAAARRIAPPPIDVAALQLSARHTEPASLAADAREELRKEGFVFVEFSASAKLATPVVVRASDMQLRLKDGRTIASYPPTAMLVVAAAGAAGPPIGGIVGLLATLATEAAASSEADRRRALLNTAFGREYFGERVLHEDKGMDGGVVFFRLPPGASADGAVVVAWAVESASAAGAKVEVPLQ